MNTTTDTYTNAIVIGSGMGGMTIASLLAKDGVNPTILEAAHVPGGCSSSFKRKGYVFESGATTLIGFDQHQPMNRLELMLGITIPKVKISPGMSVYVNGKTCIRYEDRQQWIQEASRVFGNPEGQATFWDAAFDVADTVWKVSARNTHFPPRSVSDLVRLATSNSPLDVPALRYALISVGDMLKRHDIDTREFRAFIDEQLMITAQAGADEVPFLFGAAGITYTNYANYYVPGGLLEMIRSLQGYIEQHGGQLLTKNRVIRISRDPSDNLFRVETQSGQVFRSPLVYSNLPVWNMKDLTEGDIQQYFGEQSKRYEKAWGAFTMGVVTTDTYADEMTLHHQIHLDEPMPFTGATSFFVSMSQRGDIRRAPEGLRAMNVSTHTATRPWFELNGDYDQVKQASEAFILQAMRSKLPGFADAEVMVSFGSTPVTWQNWVYRKEGRVGGIPQNMDRSLLDWSPAVTPFDGLFLCGDTVYPGQGIPGVTLSGINVYYTSEKQRKKLHTN
jgi:C-3',4' desaturase CrtD